MRPEIQICLCVLVPLLGGQWTQGTGGSPKLLVMLLDGFRWDYFKLPRLKLEGFPRIIRDGVKAEYMIPDFPTNSYPNYYTIMTGLHAETHGIVGNYMYDEHHDEYFELGENPEINNPHWWDDGEPLWITAENQGKRAYLYYWRHCQAEIRGGNPTYCLPYRTMPTMDEVRWAMADGIRQLQNSSADLVCIYHQDVDHYGHINGPNSPEVKKAIKEIDHEINKLLNYIHQNDLQDSINLVLVSDHGMTYLDELHVIDIDTALDMNDVREIIEAGSQVYIWPHDGKTEKVYNDLKNHESTHMRVYYKEELSSQWFLKKHRRIPPIFVSADLGWYIIHEKSKTIYAESYEEHWRGNHGFDNDMLDMMAIFLAVGPDFKSGYTAPAFSNVNLYNIMCNILRITPSQNDGDFDEVKDMLRLRDSSEQRNEL